MATRITHIFSGDLWAGAETQALQLIKGLQQQNQDVTALMFNEGECHSRFQSAGLSSRVVSESKSGFYSKVLKELTELEPEVIISHDYKDAFIACYYACKNKIPWMHIVHGSSESRSGIKAFKSRVYRFILFTLLRFFSSNVIVVSNTLAKQLGIEAWDKTKIIFNSVVLKNSEVKESTDSICIVGRLVPVKRVEKAIAAFEAAQIEKGFKTRLLVIGDGPERARLEKIALATKCSEQIEFLGFREDASKLIASSKMLIISSDSEGLPTVLLEAMSAMVPVVSTAVGGIPEVLAKFPTYPHRLVQLDSPQGLADGILSLLSEEKKSEDRDFLQSFIDTFSVEACVKEHLELYNQAISNSKRLN